ncbi:hypothetical protein B0T16DRAFT_510278 [Cercophora newfieldiana]|uniref:DUF7907 domain-containing protein n=1 Tax=Cercophora newfieldiana TaxID=92897 RepID=A0AA39Y563_9PEZI|nr:hypothetical protein B0T16DRAFT_510278 [Cercophora newfieldiana]
MKSTFASRALALLAGSTAVTAQFDFLSDLSTSPPFYLKVSAPDNSSIDGRFLHACHTGAATNTLCLGQHTPSTSDVAGKFYLKYKQSPDDGYLINNIKILNGSTGNVELVAEPFRLALSAATNVAMTWFSPEGFADGSIYAVKFTGDGLSLPIYPVDTDFREGVRPDPTGVDASSWYTCWVLAGSYYYNALAWVTGGIPSNPTCRPVRVVKVDVQS